MAKQISQTELSITDRFFFALEELKRRKVIRGLQTFTRRHGLNQGNLTTHKNKHRENWSLRPDLLAYLAQDYGVSCEWLLLGDGEMFVPGSPALYGK